jgi:mRNA degradation ribonuclease J1/J2
MRCNAEKFRPLKLIQNCVSDAQYQSEELPEFSKETALFVAENGFRVWFMETDHSIIGAGAFFLEDIGTGQRFIYTGDIRAHGLLPTYYNKFVAMAKKFFTDKGGVLITEGTRLGLDTPFTPVDKALESYESNEPIKQCIAQMKKNRYESETEVYSKIKDVISNADHKLVVFDCAGRDLWRFLVFYAAAKATGRTLVIDGDMFFLLTKMARRRWGCLAQCQLDTGPILEPADLDSNNFLKHLMVLDAKRRSGTFEEADHSGDQVYKQLQTLKGISEYRIKAADLGKNPENYCVYLPFSQMAQLHDIMPPDATHRLVYIHSSHFPEPDDGEGIDLLKKRLHWLDPYLSSIDDFHHIHCSGHSSEKKLKDMIAEINPPKYLLIHTTTTEKNPFSRASIEVTNLGSEIPL